MDKQELWRKNSLKEQDNWERSKEETLPCSSLCISTKKNPNGNLKKEKDEISVKKFQIPAAAVAWN